MMRPYADPSAIIAAELAFDRIAVEKGQWTAFARIAAKDAVLFVPEPVFAQRWLKGQRDPAVPLRWQTHKVFMACDGSSAVSTGAWVRGADGEHGWFTNIWRKDRKKGYMLILSHDGPLTTAPEEEPDAIIAKVAECGGPGQPPQGGGRPPRGGRPDQPQPLPANPPLDPSQRLPMDREDRSDDGTLRWRWSVGSDGARTLEAWMATEKGEVQVVVDHGASVGRSMGRPAA
jgi:hypothetical protein